MEELIQKYEQCKEQSDYYNKKMEKIKKHLKNELKKIPDNTFQNKNHKVFIKNMSRTFLNKKDVPDDIWKKYSKETPYDILYVRKIKN